MLLKHALLRILSASSLVLSVSGHARMVEPMGTEYMTDPCRGECAKAVIEMSNSVLRGEIEVDGGYEDPAGLYKNHWFTHGSTIGCEKATGTACGNPGSCCETTMEPTLTSPDQLSYQKLGMTNVDELCEYIAPIEFNNSVQNCIDAISPTNDFFLAIDAEVASGNLTASVLNQNPWFAPGYAPVEDSCGILGGWQWASARDYIAGPGDAYFNLAYGGSFINANMPPIGADPPAGTSGTSLLSHEVNMKMQEAQGDSTVSYPTVWTAGEAVNVSYSLAANHGGGHQFRLCPVENLFDRTLDEACFQANPMEFADGTSVFVGSSDDYGTVEIPFDAMDLDDSNTNGVIPTGSTWRKIGIPPCEGPVGGGAGCNQLPQFTDHAPPGIFGFGNGNPPELLSNSFNLTAFIPDWKVVDKVMVPEGLNGDYVVSWRWDSEQTPQVWTQCAIVTIVDPEDMLGDVGETGDDGDNDRDGGEDSDKDGDGECESLLDIVCGSGAFTLFCEALQAADLDKSFEEETWTFFIPNDDAFTSVGSVLESLTDDQIANILMFHVVAGQIVMSDDLVCKEEIEMFQGNDSRTKCNGGAIYQNGHGNNQLLFSPQIIQTDIEFCNGVAHVLDGVMLPPKFSD